MDKRKFIESLCRVVSGLAASYLMFIFILIAWGVFADQPGSFIIFNFENYEILIFTGGIAMVYPAYSLIKNLRKRI